MKRNALSTLKNWFEDPNRKPLIIRGARQTGKSTLVRLFAQQQKLTLLEINFEENPEYKEIFNSNNIDRILQLLEVTCRQHIHTASTLLFLDEIQFHPEAIQTLRYFYEKRPEVAICAAGSLLDFVLEDHTFSMPVGRIEYLYLGPMTYEEFLCAYGEKNLLDYIHAYCLPQDIPVSIHNQAMDLLRLYIVLGGMPGVIKDYISTQSLLSANKARQAIINTYRDDFNKYKTRINIKRLQKVFNSFPACVAKKIIYKSIDRNEGSREIEQTLHLLEMARVIYRITHTSANGIPLGAQINEKYRKGLFLDTGLLCAMQGLSLDDIKDPQELPLVNNGTLAEQFIGQHLLYSRPPYIEPQLHYWVREKATANAELDYILSEGQSIIPIEVKSGKAGRLRSLHVFMGIKKLKTAMRFNADAPSVAAVDCLGTKDPWRFSLISLPMYLVGQCRRIIREF
jgi:predicted AAA+ superfamily ATPase